MTIYLDHNATTPIRKESLDSMMPFLTEKYGNASSVHSLGREVRQAVEQARETIATIVGCSSSELYFTSGGTEANNSILFGIAGKLRERGSNRNRVLVSSIEHPSVLEAARALEHNGFQVEFLPVDDRGLVDPDVAASFMDDDTLLISVMLANNETGVLQPVREIAELAHSRGIVVHSDLVQAFGKIPVNLRELGVDAATISSHKIYGPKGIGAMYIKRGTPFRPLLYGGHQEKMKRVGTENPAAIVGFATAAELAARDLRSGVMDRMSRLRDTLEARLLEEIPYSFVNGRGAPRVPNTTNISFAFVEGEGLSLMLDALGIAVSTGSACSSGSLEPSHVLTAMGLSHELAHGSLRFSLGLINEPSQMEQVVDTVKRVVSRLRESSPLYEDFMREGIPFEEYVKRSRNNDRCEV